MKSVHTSILLSNNFKAAVDTLQTVIHIDKVMYTRKHRIYALMAIKSGGKDKKNKYNKGQGPYLTSRRPSLLSGEASLLLCFQWRRGGEVFQRVGNESCWGSQGSPRESSHGRVRWRGGRRRR